MSNQTTSPDDTEAARGTETRLPRVRRVAVPLAALAGVGLLLAAARVAGEDRRKAGLFALTGGTLLGAWFRKRRAKDTPASPDPASTANDVSAEAAAHREQSKVLHQDETNPRGTSGEPDVEVQNSDGDVEFTTDQDAGAETKPNLDNGEAGDPRVPDEGEEVSVNLSEAAMADEASEATGPTPEQSYPAMEGTDPEPTSPDAPERDGEGAGTNPGPVPDDEDGDEGTGTDSDREDAVIESSDDVDAPDVDETDDRM